MHNKREIRCNDLHYISEFELISVLDNAKLMTLAFVSFCEIHTQTH